MKASCTAHRFIGVEAGGSGWGIGGGGGGGVGGISLLATLRKTDEWIFTVGHRTRNNLGHFGVNYLRPGYTVSRSSH